MALIQEYNKLFEHTDNIKKIYVNNNIVWPVAQPQPDPKLEPFYVENISNTAETLSIVKEYDYAPTLTIEYSTDKTTWTPFENSTSTTALTYTLQPNDKLYLRCNTSRWSAGACNFINGVSKVGGNIMSLLYGNYFTGNETSFPDTTLDKIFSSLFADGNIIDASYLLLPATTLIQNCYSSMFYRCAALTAAPVLPATTLADSCYSIMFSGCTALATAPVLPATTLANYCYSNMFYGCTSLTTAPALPATTLVNNCYRNMFSNCRSLNTVECLATDISASYACGWWLSNVSATGTFTKVTGVNWPTGTSGIPSGWTVIEV